MYSMKCWTKEIPASVLCKGCLYKQKANALIHPLLPPLHIFYAEYVCMLTHQAHHTCKWCRSSILFKQDASRMQPYPLSSLISTHAYQLLIRQTLITLKSTASWQGCLQCTYSTLLNWPHTYHKDVSGHLSGQALAVPVPVGTALPAHATASTS